MGRAFVEPQKRIWASDSLLSPKINDLEPARGRTVRGAEWCGLELVSSFRGGRIHRTEHLGKGNDVVACGERDFHVVKINTKLHRHRHAYTALWSAERRTGRPPNRQNSRNRLAETWAPPIRWIWYRGRAISRLTALTVTEKHVIVLKSCKMTVLHTIVESPSGI